MFCFTTQIKNGTRANWQDIVLPMGVPQKIEYDLSAQQGGKTLRVAKDAIKHFSDGKFRFFISNGILWFYF